MNILTKSCLIIATTSLLTSALIIVDTDKAKADLFCLPWESNCHVDGEPGTSRNYYHVNIRNNTNRTIWVAVNYYKSFGPGGGNWVADGYWQLAPGERKYILGGSSNAIQNRYIYFHAHDEYGNYWGNSEHQWSVNGTLQSFFQADMGSTIREYTQSFTLE